jgi:hypothetical protein
MKREASGLESDRGGDILGQTTRIVVNVEGYKGDRLFTCRDRLAASTRARELWIECQAFYPPKVSAEDWVPLFSAGIEALGRQKLAAHHHGVHVGMTGLRFGFCRVRGRCARTKLKLDNVADEAFESLKHPGARTNQSVLGQRGIVRIHVRLI